MAASGDVLDELRVSDLVTVLAVKRLGSVSSAARDLGVTPSQVSKALSRLESMLHIRLFSRGARGVVLTDSARTVLPNIEKAVVRLQGLNQKDAPRITELTVAAPSYLIAAFLPALTAIPHVRVRGIELPPPLIRAYAPENVFEMAILPRAADRMPPTWVAVRVGEIRFGVFATPDLGRRLGPPPVSVDKLRAVPFVTPIYYADGRYIAVDDDCPLALAERIAGHAAQTITIALELASGTDQLVYGPVVAARRFLETKALVEVPVRGWWVKEPLYVACNGDRMLAEVQSAAIRALREESAAAMAVG